MSTFIKILDLNLFKLQLTPKPKAKSFRRRDLEVASMTDLDPVPVNNYDVNVDPQVKYYLNLSGVNPSIYFCKQIILNLRFAIKFRNFLFVNIFKTTTF